MFKVGDIVYSNEWGEGVVLTIHQDFLYPVVVEFDGEGVKTFTTRGKWRLDDPNTNKDITLTPKKENNDA